MIEHAEQNLGAGMASKYDAVICAALGMTEKEVLAIAPKRLRRAINGDLETVLLDGKPLVTFWPIETRTEISGDIYQLVSSQKYMVHIKGDG